jgi:hypothetical protein
MYSKRIPLEVYYQLSAMKQVDKPCILGPGQPTVGVVKRINQIRVDKKRVQIRWNHFRGRHGITSVEALLVYSNDPRAKKWLKCAPPDPMLL